MPKYISNFFRCESGASTTIEAVIWLPLYFLLLTASVDVSAMMKAQTDLWAVASNSARMVSINAMTTTEAETYARSLLTNGETIDVSISVTDGNVTSTIVRPIDDVGSIGMMQWALPDISVSTTQRVEPTA